jgi:hypothetical protein
VSGNRALAADAGYEPLDHSAPVRCYSRPSPASAQWAYGDAPDAAAQAAADWMLIDTLATHWGHRGDHRWHTQWAILPGGIGWPNRHDAPTLPPPTGTRRPRTRTGERPSRPRRPSDRITHSRIRPGR